MRVHVKCTDGIEFEAEHLYNWDRKLAYATDTAYLIVPWDDLDKAWVTYEDFQEAQKAAKEDRLEAVLEEGRKKLAPKHESDGFTWREAT